MNSCYDKRLSEDASLTTIIRALLCIIRIEVVDNEAANFVSYIHQLYH